MLRLRHRRGDEECQAVAEYDVLSEGFFADPYPTLSAMRKDHPCWYDPRLDAYVITRYNDIFRVLCDDRFSSQRVRQFVRGAPDNLQDKIDVYVTELERWLLFCDPPIHSVLRARLIKGFGPQFLPLIEETAAAAVATALARLAEVDDPDVIRDFAYPVPTQILARLLGIDRADIERFKQWTNDIFTLIGSGVANEESVLIGYRGVTELRSYVLDLIREKRERPQDDVLSALCRKDASDDDAQIGDDDIVALFMTIIVAGHETSTNLIGNAIHGILGDPRCREWVAARNGVSEEAVDELVRYDGPVFSLIRRAKCDVAIGGSLVKEGSFVFSMLNSGNRDPRKFGDPDRLNFDRPLPAHLGFGTGIHRCVGATMARIVVREAVSGFMRSFPAITVSDGCVRQRNMSIRGFTSFPVRLQTPK